MLRRMITRPQATITKDLDLDSVLILIVKAEVDIADLSLQLARKHLRSKAPTKYWSLGTYTGLV